MNLNHKETIAAIATAPGRGGIGVIRLSGSTAYSLAQSLTRLTSLTARHAYYGEFIHPSTGELIDTGITLYFPGPHSFTGEDVVEFQGHGGPIVLDQLLRVLISQGVRIARPGEFSERAFLNDKIDLTQAEAIADLINASSEQAAKNAINSLKGEFSNKINTFSDKLTELRIYVEAAIDFPEEEIDFLQDGKIQAKINDIKQQLDHIFKQAKQGILISEGMKVVIAGKPNAGKSSLLNQLSGKDTAIVTDIAGTTRDVVKEHVHIDGMPLHIIDTAGLRDSNDIVEQIGIQRAWDEINQADRILLLVDSQNSIDPTTDLALFLQENDDKSIDKSLISVIYNKIDQNKKTPKIAFINEIPSIYLSAKTGEGIHLLKDHLKDKMGYKATNEGGFTARRRHIDALSKAQVAINRGEQQLHHGSGELLAEELRLAQQHLGEITGKISADELLGKIFSSFCIGK